MACWLSQPILTLTQLCDNYDTLLCGLHYKLLYHSCWLSCILQKSKKETTISHYYVEYWKLNIESSLIWPPKLSGFTRYSELSLWTKPIYFTNRSAIYIAHNESFMHGERKLNLHFFQASYSLRHSMKLKFIILIISK